jgi:aminoglycoside phosphotransferase (APT) family kinase protein
VSAPRAPEAAEALATRLLDYLRRELATDPVTLARPPQRLTSGFEAITYKIDLVGAPAEFSRPLILRIFTERHPPGHAQFERAVQNAVAAQGFPVARVLLTGEVSDGLGAPFVIMERLPGVPMLDLLKNPARGRRVARMLAALHAQLHALDPAPLRAQLDGMGANHGISTATAVDELEQRIDRAGLDGMRDGIAWLHSHQPKSGAPEVICHGDFHANNVLVVGDRVSGVIDWSITRIGPAEFDVGSTLMIMKLGPRGVPRVLDPVVGFLSRNLARRYYAAYRSLHPVDHNAVRYYEGLRCFQSLVWAGEHRVALSHGLTPGPNPWAAPLEANRLASHFRAISGVRLSPPPAPP